jgi:hypothetical protein
MNPSLAWSDTYPETIRPNVLSGSIIIAETHLLPSSVTSE